MVTLDDDALIHAYVEQHRRVDNIARSAGVPSSAITRRLGQLGVLRRSGPARAVEVDPAELHDLYVTQSMSVPAIAAHFGVSPPTIRKRITAAGLTPSRTVDDAALRLLYVDELLTVPAIADRHSLGYRSAARRILAAGLLPSRPYVDDHELALDLYYVHNLTPAGIARALNTTRVAVEQSIATAGRRHVTVDVIVRSRQRDATTLRRIEHRIGSDNLAAHLGLAPSAIATLRG